MTPAADPLRDHLVRLLDWEEAHAGFARAVAGLGARHRGVRPPGFEHSAWQLVEHMRLAQRDLLDFCVDAQYAHALAWPDDYWPRDPAPPDEAAWDASLRGYASDLRALKDLVANPDVDLLARVPTGKQTHTYLRAVLLAADHTAYHVGQLVALRRALGAW